MAENKDDQPGTSKDAVDSVEFAEDEIDMREIEQLDAILGNSPSEKVKMLEFERQMFLDCCYNDGLVICGKGIPYEKVLLNMFRVYVDPSNLVLVLNSDDYEETYYTKLLESPHVHQASNNANEREKVYLSGGIQFISTQVLVIDLLKGRVPAELITGIIVLRAHQIIESCQEAFALRLYRQKNKIGFIKAFTLSAEAFTYGYGHVEKVMRNLFVKELYLWPRFHALIQKNLKAFEPISVEFHIPMTPKMVQIQTHLLDLMNYLVKELKRINPHVDLEEVTVENCVSKRFQKILQSQLDVIWNQLSSKTKLLIADLKVLRSLMFTTIYNDSITLHSTLKRYRTADYAMSNSGWTLLSSAEQVFKLAKERVFNKKDEFDPEPCPKWKSLSEVLRVEIPSDIKNMIKDKRFEFDETKQVRILVLCNDARTCYQLNQYLTQGLERTLFWTALKSEVPVQKLSSKYKTLQGDGSGTVKDAVNVDKVKLRPEKPATTVVQQNIPLVVSMLKSRKRKNEADATSSTDEKSTEATEEETEEEEFFKDSYVLTMTQKIGGNESFSAADFDLTQAENVEFELCDDLFTLDATCVMTAMQKPTVCIQTFSSDRNKASSLDQTLHEMKPDYIVLYNSNVRAIRQIEVFEARLQRHQRRRLKVFVLMHSKTVEEQNFLTTLRREKRAFELLIETKRTMVIPEHQDGKTDVTSYLHDTEEDEAAGSSRQAGGQIDATKKREPPRIIVDSREFRSDLPCLIHRRGIEVVPLMITIGDYILSPEICVERKSISDLIGSLNSGRLYNQCQQMTRYYSKPILLIEFDQNKPFHLQGRYMLSRDSDVNNAEIMQKLQLLTIHFPKLRLVWSPSPYATAQLFEEIKQNKEQPDPNAAVQSGNEDQLENDVISERYNSNIHDFMLKLPGVNLKNIHSIMRKGKNLKEMLKMDEAQLTALLGNDKDAKALWTSLHAKLKPSQDDPKAGGKFKKTFKK